jgi:branched-chain amino acid transport system substrate-binding protein
LTFCALVLSLLAGTADAQSPNSVKIGVLNDQSGIYADLAGPGSVIAARLAVEDAGGSVLGRSIEVVVADHQGKPDIGAAIARRWYDADDVSAIFDVPVSSIALAVQEVARQKNRIAIFSSASASDILGKSCNRTTFQWTFNTLSAARSTASLPVDDMMTHGAHIRDDGWVMRDLFLFQVKTPAESKAPWDYYKLLAKIGAEQAAPPRLPECK